MVVGVKIPDTCRAIVGTGDDESIIFGVIQRDNLALMAFKRCANLLVLDIPDLV